MGSSLPWYSLDRTCSLAQLDVQASALVMDDDLYTSCFCRPPRMGSDQLDQWQSRVELLETGVQICNPCWCKRGSNDKSNLEKHPF